MISSSPFHTRLQNGRSCVLILMTASGGCSGPLGYTTVTLLSCPVKARTFPLGEKAHECTQPPALFKYSPQTVLNGRRSPHTDGSGRSSTPTFPRIRPRWLPGTSGPSSGSRRCTTLTCKNSTNASTASASYGGCDHPRRPGSRAVPTRRPRPPGERPHRHGRRPQPPGADGVEVEGQEGVIYVDLEVACGACPLGTFLSTSSQCLPQSS